MFVDHMGVWKPQNNNATVWRYMSLAKYIAILTSRSVYLSNISKFPDRQEGTLPQSFIERELYLTENVEDANGKHLVSSIETRVSEYRKHAYALCWHESEYESALLWKGYTTECNGIAIKSTVSRLAQIGANLVEPVYVGKVRYFDFSKAPVPENLLSSTFYPLLMKDIAYSAENEVRVLYCDWSVLSRLNFDRGIIALNDETQFGISMPVDLAAIVTECVLPPRSPSWYRELICGINAQSGYPQIPVRNSSIQE